MTRPPSTRTKIISDPIVASWYRNTARGAPSSADSSLRRLGMFAEVAGVAPSALLTKNERQLRTLFEEFISRAEKMKSTPKRPGEKPTRTLAGSYIAAVVKAVRSFLAFNDVRAPGQVKVADSGRAPNVEDERIPNPEDLRKVLLSATPRDRLATILVAHGGMRLEILGSYRGDDGLRWGDFLEGRVSGARVEFEKVPTLVRIRASLSKSRRPFHTFLGAEAVVYVKEVLEARLRAGERLTPESAVIAPERVGEGQYLHTTNVGAALRGPIRAAGFSFRPYAWRSYFLARCQEAASRAGGRGTGPIHRNLGRPRHRDYVASLHDGPGRPP